MGRKRGFGETSGDGSGDESQGNTSKRVDTGRGSNSPDTGRRSNPPDIIRQVYGGSEQREGKRKTKEDATSEQGLKAPAVSQGSEAVESSSRRLRRGFIIPDDYEEDAALKEAMEQSKKEAMEQSKKEAMEQSKKEAEQSGGQGARSGLGEVGPSNVPSGGSDEPVHEEGSLKRSAGDQGDNQPKRRKPSDKSREKTDSTQEQQNLQDPQANVESLLKIEGDMLYVMRIFATRENMRDMRIPQNFSNDAIKCNEQYLEAEKLKRRNRIIKGIMGAAGLSGSQSQAKSLEFQNVARSVRFQHAILPFADFILSNRKGQYVGQKVLKQFVEQTKGSEGVNEKMRRFKYYQKEMGECTVRVDSYKDKILFMKESIVDIRKLDALLESFSKDKDDMMAMAALVESNYLESNLPLDRHTKKCDEISKLLARSYTTIMQSCSKLKIKSEALSSEKWQEEIINVVTKFSSVVQDATDFGVHYVDLAGIAIRAQQVVKRESGPRTGRPSDQSERPMGTAEEISNKIHEDIEKNLKDAQEALGSLESRQDEMLPPDVKENLSLRYSELFARIRTARRQSTTLAELQLVAATTGHTLKALQDGKIKDILRTVAMYVASSSNPTDCPDLNELTYWDRKPFQPKEDEEQEASVETTHESSEFGAIRRSDRGAEQMQDDAEASRAQEQKRDPFEMYWRARQVFLAKNGSSVSKVARKNFRKSEAEQEQDDEEARKVQEAKDQDRSIKPALVREIRRDQRDPFEKRRSKFRESLAELEGAALLNEVARYIATKVRRVGIQKVAFVFDADRTLIPHGASGNAWRFSDETIKAMHEVLKLGGTVIINTGRPISNASRDKSLEGIDEALDNSGPDGRDLKKKIIICDATRNVLRGPLTGEGEEPTNQAAEGYLPLSEELTEAVVNAIDGDQTIIDYKESDFIPADLVLMNPYKLGGAIRGKTLDAIEKQIAAKAANDDDSPIDVPKTFKAIKEKLREIMLDVLQNYPDFVLEERLGLEIRLNSATTRLPLDKGDGIYRVVKDLGLKYLLAFGDGFVDIPMALRPLMLATVNELLKSHLSGLRSGEAKKFAQKVLVGIERRYEMEWTKEELRDILEANKVAFRDEESDWKELGEKGLIRDILEANKVAFRDKESDWKELREKRLKDRGLTEEEVQEKKATYLSKDLRRRIRKMRLTVRQILLIIEKELTKEAIEQMARMNVTKEEIDQIKDNIADGDKRELMASTGLTGGQLDLIREKDLKEDEIMHIRGINVSEGDIKILKDLNLQETQIEQIHRLNATEGNLRMLRSMAFTEEQRKQIRDMDLTGEDIAHIRNINKAIEDLASKRGSDEVGREISDIIQYVHEFNVTEEQRGMIDKTGFTPEQIDLIRRFNLTAVEIGSIETYMRNNPRKDQIITFTLNEREIVLKEQEGEIDQIMGIKGNKDKIEQVKWKNLMKDKIDQIDSLNLTEEQIDLIRRLNLTVKAIKMIRLTDAQLRFINTVKMTKEEIEEVEKLRVIDELEDVETSIMTEASIEDIYVERTNRINKRSNQPKPKEEKPLYRTFPIDIVHDLTDKPAGIIGPHRESDQPKPREERPVFRNLPIDIVHDKEGGFFPEGWTQEERNAFIEKTAKQKMSVTEELLSLHDTGTILEDFDFICVRRPPGYRDPEEYLDKVSTFNAEGVDEAIDLFERIITIVEKDQEIIH